MAVADSPSPGSRPSGRVRLVLIGLAILILVVGLYLFGGWWTHGRFVEGTNDAYVHADQVTVAPKISGYVAAVYVRDNQAVASGQPLVRIEPNAFDAALTSQKAAVAARRADVEAARRQVAQQEAGVLQARAQLRGAEEAAAYAAREAARFMGLSREGAETEDRAAQALNQKTQADAVVRADEAAVLGAERQTATLEAQIGQAEAQSRAAEAQLTTAQINLGDTLLRASIAGRIGDKNVSPGQLVQPGTRLMSVVPVQDVYLVGNFKETQIGRMRVGQAAKVRLDAFAGREVPAVLESFAPGTGAQFALLPPENATGNFTKIVQRVPVRFRLNPPADLRDRILPGLSATVTVDTTQSRGSSGGGGGR